MDKMEKSPKPSIHLNEFNSTANLTANPGFQSSLTLDGLGVSEKDDLYEPFDHRKVEHPNSDWGSLIHLLKSSLGSGILAMPNAFKNAGLVLGAVGTIVIGLICTHCVHILVTISREVCKIAKEPSMDFAQTCGAAFRYGPEPLRRWGPAFRSFVDWALVATYLGASCVYVVLIAESFHEVVEQYFPEGNWDVKIYCALLLVPLVLLGQIRNLKYLVPFSAIANLFLLLSLAITMFYIFQGIPPANDKKLVASIGTLPLFVRPSFAISAFGIFEVEDGSEIKNHTVIFAMEGIGVVMPVENDMAKPGHFLGCPGVLNTAMSFVVGLYAIVGFFGYLRFGDDVKGTITATLSKDLIPAQVAKVSIGLAILFTYGLQFYVPMDIIFKKLDSKVQEKYLNFTHIGLRTFCVTASVAIAAAVPNLELLISLVGAVFFSTLGLLVPAVVETAHRWDRGLGRGQWVMWKNIVIGMFSILALVSGSYQSISAMISG